MPGVFDKIATLINAAIRGRRSEGTLQYFLVRTDVRMARVKDVAAGRAGLSDDLTPPELVAAFHLMLLTEPFSDVVQKAVRFADNGWTYKFDDAFFTTCDEIAAEFRARGWDQAARNLTRFAEALAQALKVA